MFVLVLALLALSLPYLVVVLAAPAGGAYTGLYFTPSDGYLYLGQMYQAHYGGWAYLDYFTYRMEPSVPVYLVYSVLGHLVLPDPTPTVLGLAYHLSRLILAGFFIYQLWRLYEEVIPNRVAQRTALILALFGSGLGLWLEAARITIAGQHPYDLTQIESSTFFSLLYAPHFVVVLIGLVVFLRGWHRVVGSDQFRLRATLAAGVGAGLMVAVHPDKAILLSITVAGSVAWLAINRRLNLRHLTETVAVLILMSPNALLVGYLGTSNSFARYLLHAGLQNPVKLRLVYYVLGYGFPAVLAACGLRRLWRPRRLAGAEAVLWSMVLGNVIVMAIPGTAVFHSGEGLALVLDALAARYLIGDVLPRLWRSRLFTSLARRPRLGYDRRRLRELTINLVLILASTSVMTLVLLPPRAAIGQAPDLFLSRDDLATIAYVRQHLSAGDVVAARPESEDFLAAYGGVHVVLGHYSFTPDLEGELSRQGAFFSDSNVDIDYLRSRSITWLYFGPREAASARFDPSRSPLLAKRFESGSTALYEVVLP